MDIKHHSTGVFRGSACR